MLVKEKPINAKAAEEPQQYIEVWATLVYFMEDSLPLSLSPSPSDRFGAVRVL